MNTLDEFLSPRFRWVYTKPDPDLKAEISKKYDIPLPLAEVLLKRGIVADESVIEYFDTPLSGLINPFMMKDMDKGVERIIKALKAKELICIFGDYDVDGVTSTSLLYLFFKELNGNIMHYIPNRLEEGYGLNGEAIEELYKKGVKLIITVDCGISAVEEVSVANSFGMDVVITDHHQASEVVPDAVAVINPMQDEDSYPFKSLAGVGVAFKLCMAVRYALRSDSSWKAELPNLKQYLDIVTLGTIADVVPLRGENRIFVIHGLKSLSSSNLSRPGIDELKKVSGVSKMALTASHVGFGLAPRINAVGRLGNSDRGFRLLVTADLREAKRLAMELDQENRYRQGIEREILEEVFKQINNLSLHEKYRGLVLYSDNWHPGVLGIVASRVADKYHRPTIILTEESGLLKGSARSIPGFHLYEGLKELSDILVSFGGHKYAAGLKIKSDNIELLQNRFDGLVRSTLDEKEYIPEITIDSFIETSDLNANFLEYLQKFEPYGNSNKEPIFCIKSVNKYQQVTYVGKQASHAKFFFSKNGVVFDAIGYDMRSYDDIFTENDKFDIIFSLSYNTYSRNRAVQVTVKDIRVSC